MKKHRFVLFLFTCVFPFMKTHRKTLAALVFAVTALFTAMAAISAEEYVIGEEYYKDFPGSGHQLMKVLEISEYDEQGYIVHSIFTPSEIEYYGQEYWYEYTYWPDGTRKTRILFVRTFNPSGFTFPPSPTFDYKTVKMQEIAVEAGGIYRVLENLRLRENENTVGEIITTMQAGTLVKVLSLGKEETIDGIKSNWVQIEVQQDGKDKDGNPIKAGTVGWCFGGYLK